MIKQKLKCLLQLCVASFAVLSLPSMAAPSFTLGPKISSLGVGSEATVKVTETCHFRFGANTFQYSKKFNHNQINWEGKLKLFTLGAFFDYHPFENGVFLSAGPVYNENKLKVSASPNQSITINNITYTAQQLGSLKGQLRFHKVSPYVGIGYNSAFTNLDNLSFVVELGMLFQGKARANISATGTYSNNANMLANLKTSAEQAANKPWIRYYPVVALGLVYRF